MTDQPVNPAIALFAADLIVALYQLPACSAGGPLHVQLDDYNVEDHWWSDEYTTRDHPPYQTPVIQLLCPRITAYLRDLTIDQRKAVITAAHQTIVTLPRTPDRAQELQRGAFKAGFLNGAGYGHLGSALGHEEDEFEEWMCKGSGEVVEATEHMPAYVIPGYEEF